MRTTIIRSCARFKAGGVAGVILLGVLLPLASNAQVPGYTITTAAGTGQCCEGGKNPSGPGPSIVLPSPAGLAVDASGNLFIAADGLILKMDAAGIVSTIAGGGAPGPTLGDGGPATAANLLLASGVAADSNGNVYIADSGHNRIRKISKDGNITTIAGPGSTAGILGDGGPAIDATLSKPADVALDSDGNIYIADSNNSRVRKITPDGNITTIAGSGSYSDPTSSGITGDGGLATKAFIGQPMGVALDNNGNLHIADSLHNVVRKVTRDGIITTVAGNGVQSYSGDGGQGSLGSLFSPQKVAVDASGNLYIADLMNNRIRMVGVDGKIVTIAGNGTYISSGDGGPGTNAGLRGPDGVAAGPGGKIYISERAGSPYSERIRLLTPNGKQVFPPPAIANAISAGAFGGFKQVALGGWIEVYGSYLAGNARSWVSGDFSGPNAPTSLDSTSVTIGGQPAFVDYISPGQVNVQVPSNVGTGSQLVVVQTPNGSSAPFTVTVNPEEPGLLAPASFKIKSFPYVVATFPDGTFVLAPGAISGLPSRRAKEGDTITLYGVGFGPVSPNIPAGRVVSESNSLVLPIHFFIDNREAAITFEGLAPNTIGLYQFNIVVPKGPFGGFASLTFNLGGLVGQQTVNIAVE